MRSFCLTNKKPLLSLGLFLFFGAEEETRTLTPIRAQPPQGCVSTNFTTSARDVARFYINISKMQIYRKIQHLDEFIFHGTPCWSRTMQAGGFEDRYSILLEFILVRPAGVEPATNGFEDRYSIH